MKTKKPLDKIGWFKGKPITKMTREELLEFAEWAGKEIHKLNKEASKYKIDLS